MINQPLPPERVEEMKRQHAELMRQITALEAKARMYARLIEFAEQSEAA